MSYPTWPKSLVQFERSGWQSQTQEARRRWQGDAGPPAWRRRFSSVARIVTLALVTDRNGKAIFDRFFEEDCDFGSRLFWMPDPATDGWGLLRSTGAPLLVARPVTAGPARTDIPLTMSARWLCSFGDDPPVETMVGDSEFRKSFSVVVMP